MIFTYIYIYIYIIVCGKALALDKENPEEVVDTINPNVEVIQLDCWQPLAAPLSEALNI